MPDLLDPHIANAASRGRGRLETGASLHELLRMFREEEKLGLIQSILALRAIEPIDLGVAKELVASACDGKSYAHLGLEDLARLAETGSLPGCWLRLHLRDAIIAKAPFRLFVAGGTQSCVKFYEGRSPDEEKSGSISGDGVSFAKLTAEARAAVTDAAWAAEVEIVRDDEDGFLVSFSKVCLR